MLETERAWLAGIYDGEGCFTFNRNRSRENAPTPIVYVNNTSEPMMLRIASLLKQEGIVFQFKQRNKNAASWNPLWKTNYYIRIARNEDVLSILRLIRPYLVGKIEEANLLYECVLHSKSQPRGEKGKSRIPFANRLWALNKKGVGRVSIPAQGGK